MKKGNILLALSMLVISFVIFFLYVVLSKAGMEDGDSVTHYLIAHNAFDTPKLLLDHWGKPFFTLVSAPFAYFGFRGIQIFNLLCGAATALVTYRIAVKLNISYPYVVIPFVIFTPVYLLNLPTGLTEPFFSLVLMGSILLFMSGRGMAAAILVSFLPFCRSEGNLILPLFALALLSMRNYKAIPFLASGTVLYSLIGGIVFGDLLWLFHQNPYKGADIYGHGTLFYFIEGYQKILGKPLGIAFGAGLLFGIVALIRKGIRLRPERSQVAEALLIYGSFLVYVIAHIIFWWKGIFGSAGMHRVMAAVSPCAAIVALRGLDWVVRLLMVRLLKLLAVLAYTAWVIYFVIDYNRLPQEPDARLQPVLDAVAFADEQYPGHYLYYSHPFARFAKGLNPVVPSPQAAGLSGYLPDTGSYVVIWDPQFGPFEAGMPLEKIENKAGVSLVKTFSPPFDIEVRGGMNYKIYVFVKE